MSRLIIIILLLGCLSAHARLGETREQLIQRFGEPIHVGKTRDRLRWPVLDFEEGPYRIAAVLSDTGRCVALHYWLSANDTELTMQEKITLAKKSVRGWQRWPDDPDYYISLDRKVRIRASGPRLQMETFTYLKAIEVATKAAEEAEAARERKLQAEQKAKEQREREAANKGRGNLSGF